MNFTDKERNVFKYFNGEAEVYGDPLEFNDRVDCLLNGNTNAVIEKKNAEQRTPIALEAERQFAEAVDRAFEMVPFDVKTGKGVTREIREEAWRTLVYFLQKKSLDSDETQNLQAATA